jgi:hypothetical protein
MPPPSPSFSVYLPNTPKSRLKLFPLSQSFLANPSAENLRQIQQKLLGSETFLEVILAILLVSSYLLGSSCVMAVE